VDKWCSELAGFGRKKTSLKREYGHDPQVVMDLKPVKPPLSNDVVFWSHAYYGASVRIFMDTRRGRETEYFDLATFREISPVDVF
jgi:hypothetical protein